jgi:hypothetical protein
MNIERHTSDLDAYQTYVGSISVDEFIAPFERCENPVTEAVKAFLLDYSRDETPPEWLGDALARYVSLVLEHD